MAGYTYDSLKAQLAEVLVVELTDEHFLIALPSAISDAEERICRDVDYLGAVVTSTITLTANNRNIDWSDAFFVVQSLNVITPSSVTNPELGTRNPILPATKEFCDFTYPSVTGAGVPAYLGRVTQSGGVLAPWPDANYTVEVTGTQRPITLSATNQTNFIGTYLSDLLFDACMIWLAGWQQNFSAAGDNPAQAVNWNGRYTSALQSALVEEARKRFTSEGWSAAAPAPLATPPRT